ncbi:MAG TPA: hypothetical protein VJA47_06700 [archaeon]|nr:hypothetical protein [archaeon]
MDVKSRAFMGNLVGGAVGAFGGYCIEPLSAVKEFTRDSIYNFYESQDPLYTAKLLIEFRDNFEQVVDHASRVPFAVLGGVAGWVIGGYVVRRLCKNSLDDV